METELSAYQELFAELSDYEKYGIRMTMDGVSASPMQITAAHMMKEEGTYMRDYLTDEDGRIKEIRFLKVNEEK
ncbi:hypothetical protein [Lachnoclostridium sp. An181]|uniref:hypothetical protein n=1 Tax=Lachnoclostridium sp. An181 TaxID=1965575 RepID=UPI000B38D192|nr:hypothetical protein [Lachnoclostridium sp. An181]OUP50303.1 hypothetical protein B5F18_03730 [Lachnoclostridium sp. An181]